MIYNKKMEDGIEQYRYIENVDEKKEMYELNKKHAISIVEEIYKEYENDPYMISKTNSFIGNQLKNVLENIKKIHKERTTRIEILTQGQDTFIQSFLSNNQYYYITTTEKFFFYDGLHYCLFNEDDILYHILSSITQGGALMSWKQKTRIQIMKRIREQSLIKTIPESATIQNVISSLYPILFSSKNEVKYFLTILGDSILRKPTAQYHFLQPYTKLFIQELNKMSYSIFGYSLKQSIKYKYYEHNYEDCRLLRINDCVKNESIWRTFLTDSALDILCVACHYSNRYGSAEDFLTKFLNDEVLSSNVLYISQKTPESLIKNFIDEYIDVYYGSSALRGVRTTPITWKNMQYLWKQFLDSKNLPNVILLQSVKTNIIANLQSFYKEDMDEFHNLSSKSLPEIQKFIHFWNGTMIQDETEDNLEIEEVIILFRKWCSINHEYPSILTDQEILNLINYYYPTVDIERDKYISNIRCILWDKQMDIDMAMNQMRHELREGLIDNSNISINDSYLYYCKFNPPDSKIMNVSKIYFENYLLITFEKYILESKYLKREWFEDEQII